MEHERFKGSHFIFCQNGSRGLEPTKLKKTTQTFTPYFTPYSVFTYNYPTLSSHASGYESISETYALAMVFNLGIDSAPIGSLMAYSINHQKLF